MLKQLLKSCVKQCLYSIYGSVGWSIKQRGPHKLIVLMYHRILPKSDERYHYEEPGMIVTPESFRMHMEELHQSGLPIVDLSKWARLPDKDKPDAAIAITFDDGWLDNYEFAFPILAEYHFPATLYVVSDFIGQAAPFWPNRILRLLLNKTDFSLQAYANLIELTGPVPATPLSKDQAAAIIQRLKKFDDDVIFNALVSAPSDELGVEMMNFEQLKDAQQRMNITIGCHTKSHRRLLEGTPSERLHAEIIDSKHQLEQQFAIEIDSFCFPNGDYSEAALALVEENYKNAVTTLRGHNNAMTPVHQLVRIGVHNDIASQPLAFKARLSGLI
ncbi:polysaccharide deacetylase family protein [Alteromonas sp. ASW11-36]|uniref:Polysaccharide deacetylase family protein n=1 Tax=Alteromonas arenosi TaxID=3055817 RepID=A0ABT7SU10_9ALTE|nr:polysaccharide deacetylase family protein [Alteromonas sp. ASW11-36]MDM7859640.1 polysaccharide deacetylase family protein [Alteromonas sp. ASW11-36]